MEFTNEFSVAAPLAAVWDFMLDVQQVAPCVPGATLTEVVDETHYKGTVKIKLGAVQITYRGELELNADKDARRIELKVKGTESRGSGGATGTITSTLSQQDGQTHVEIISKVDVSGRVAQFGRGIMQDVTSRMIGQFAACIQDKLVAGEAATAQAAESKAPAAPQAATGAPAKPASQAKPPAEPSPSAPGTAAGVPASSTASPAPSVLQQAKAPTPSNAVPAPPRPSSSQPPARSNELSLSNILLDILKSRTAALLRFLADRLEPK
ncbi:MAG: CoxG family protein [Chloroflexota bacterium]